MHNEEKPMIKKLSKGVLDLKFMKKSKEKAQLLEENEERQSLYQDQLSSLLEGADRIVMVNSYYDCMDFLPCRLSFGGMDPDIEKLNEEKLTGLYKVTKPPPPETVTKMEADVTAEEMAKKYKPTSKYAKRKSDHLDDINAKREATDEEHVENMKNKRGRGKSSGFNNHTRPIFQDNGGRGNFRGGNRRGNSFRGSSRGNFRGRGRGRGKFMDNSKGQDHFRGNNNRGNKREPDNFYGTKSENQGTEGNNMQNKKMKFMKPQ